MTMHRRLWILVALCGLFFPRGWAIVETDASTQRIALGKGPLTHLTPLRILPPWRGRDQVHFVCAPSFESIKVLTLSGSGEAWMLRVWETDEISNLLIKDKPVLIAKRAIGRDLAELLYRTWVNALLEVRATNISTAAVDGVCYAFSSWVYGLGELSGEANNPQVEAPPLWLAEIGDALVAYTKTSAPDEKGISRIRDLCNRTLAFISEQQAALAVPSAR
jgi:hypothetical protein